MEKRYEDIGGGLKKMICTAQGTRERDAFLTVIPQPVPENRTMVIRWISEMEFEVLADVKPELVSEAAVDQKVADRERLRQSLTFKNAADLETYAAEKSVTIDLVTWRKWTKAQRIEHIVQSLMPSEASKASA